ncbi:hypothetical protein [Rhodovulum marinum]|uniref:Uncharacterized protein n=1 Tax=Rhodovulum marinum TaxID=320662 RepID=A0A4V2SRS0_9RHOB|nr:hypothetical protein [Rhodovulum marinum]TCP43926.1 hypothetical protein EV662_1019 [Rhodovulum marinum]
MVDLPPKPVFTRTISVGNVIQVAVILVGFGGSWVAMTSDLAAVASDVAAVEEEIDEAAAARLVVEGRVRALEIEAARADERYSQLLANIQAIRDSIARLEQKAQ